MPSFPKEILERAFDRQSHFKGSDVSNCGDCGKEIYWGSSQKSQKGAWQAHHVNGDNEDHRLDNCVCLCINEPENCHLKAHVGDYGCDTVLAKTWFRYFYG